MSQWSATRARRVSTALLRIGWRVKGPVGGSDALLALLHQKVDVGPTCGIGM
jgi:hypothetical protein